MEKISDWETGGHVIAQHDSIVDKIAHLMAWVNGCGPTEIRQSLEATGMLDPDRLVAIEPPRLMPSFFTTAVVDIPGLNVSHQDIPLSQYRRSSCWGSRKT
jgi:hypothetical protein